MSHIPKTAELIDPSHTLAAPLLLRCEYAWQALPKLSDFIRELSGSLSKDEYESPTDGVFISKGACVAPTALILAPCIIGKGAQIRHGAYIRGSAIIGDGAVIGTSTEIKNSIVCDGAALPHYNYVGDSVIGYRAHLGAGAIISNLRSDRGEVFVRCGGESVASGLRKFGAIVGDRCEIGCGAVLNPGCIVGRDSQVYPLVSLRGVIAAGHIVKSERVSVKRT